MRRRTKAARYVALTCGLIAGLSGCRHKTQVAPLPVITTPVDLVEIPRPAAQPMVEVPPEKLPPVPVSAAAAKPKRERRRPKVVPPPVTAPVQTSTAEPSPDVTAIGALTTTGETSPQVKQDATDLIASIEKRLNALPTQTSDEQKAQINKVRNFWKDAQDALKSGDAEGAKTLATKAKLLLDDLEK